MFFRILLISILLLIISLLVSTIIPENSFLTQTHSFTFRYDNLVLFSIGIISMIALSFGVLMDRRTYRKKIKDRDIQIEDLKMRLQSKVEKPEPGPTSEAEVI